MFPLSNNVPLLQACLKSTGQKLDDLWRMSRQRGPQYVNSQGIASGNSKAVVLSSATTPKKAPKPNKPKRNDKMPRLIPARSDLLENSAHVDDDDSESSGMPGLQTDSSGFTDEDSESDSEDEDSNDEDEDDESAYESGEEDQMRKFEARAIDLVFADPDFLDPTKDKDGDRYSAERKSNPFLNMLGNLRGMC